MADFDRFEGTVARLEQSLKEHRAEMHKVERDIRHLTWYLAVVAVFTVVAIVATAAAVKLTFDTRDSAARRAADMREGRISSCVQQNVQTQRAREAQASSILALADDPAHLTPEEQALAAAYRQRVEEALPYRDCTPQGIAEYFEDPPADPASKED